MQRGRASLRMISYARPAVATPSPPKTISRIIPIFLGTFHPGGALTVMDAGCCRYRSRRRRTPGARRPQESGA